jgi:hypothetical protein
VLFFSEPSEQQFNRFLARASSLEFSYSELGATNSAMLPPLFTADRNRIQLGSGSLAWHRSIDALRRWEMFNIPWVRLCWPTAPIAERSNVAVLAHRIGLFWLNACRIVYLIDEDGPQSVSDSPMGRSQNMRNPARNVSLLNGTVRPTLSLMIYWPSRVLTNSCRESDTQSRVGCRNNSPRTRKQPWSEPLLCEQRTNPSLPDRGPSTPNEQVYACAGRATSS